MIIMLALDHIVISGTNAEQASEQYGKKLSIKAVKGGEHESWGTYNYLAYFSNSCYIEWLGIHDLQRAKQVEIPLIQHLVHTVEAYDKAVPFQFALRTNKLDEYVNHFKRHHIPYKGPFSGQRKKPDGTMITWRMLFPEYDFQTEMLPFLIEWETMNDIRGLDNPQAITSLKFGGMTKEQFTHMYNLKPRKILKHFVRLRNTKLYFTDYPELSFKLE